MSIEEISPELFVAIESELIALSAGRWTFNVFELQEEGTFLAIQIDVGDTESNEAVRRYLEEIASLIRPKLPVRENGFAWLVGADRRGEIVDVEIGWRLDR